jgi:hypothetical protein
VGPPDLAARVAALVPDAARDAALHHAARAGVPEAVRVLLDRGADPRARDAAGKTPYDLAREAWEQRPREAGAIFELLTARGANPASPEARSQKPEAGSWLGARVHHPKFGEGVVEGNSDGKLTIRFDKLDAPRTLLARCVKRV